MQKKQKARIGSKSNVLYVETLKRADHSERIDFILENDCLHFSVQCINKFFLFLPPLCLILNIQKKTDI